jgi:hypothetical protein
MENQILDDYLGTIPYGKLYKDKSLVVAALFGGPLAAGYLLSENFKAFGETSKSGKTRIYTVLITVLFFIVLFNFPRRIAAPIQILEIIPFISVVASYVILANFQGRQIDKHIIARGKFHSVWRALLIGIICLLITLASIIGLYVMAVFIYLI